MDNADYYQILDLQADASAAQIKEAYRNLAFQYHPDRNDGNPDALEKMKRVNEAYAVLSNPERRREYDALRQRFGSSAYGQFRKTYSEQDIFRGSDVQHIFEEMARSFGFRGFEEVFKEFYGQGYQTFEFKRPGMFGRGFVFYGPLRSGKRSSPPPPLLNPLGQAARYLFGKLTGVEIPKDGTDITDEICLTPEHAERGGPFAYFYRQKSKKLVVKIPPGVKDGQRIRLAGLGKDGKGGGTAGDLFLKVHIRLPLVQKAKTFFAGLIR
jgi:DnaJ-class molecular chaperone